jgi:hypothetical protein
MARLLKPSTIRTGNKVEVSALGDFPTPVSGVITLEDDATYELTQSIDLAGNRLVGGQNTVIIGGSSENCILTSTGLSASTALLSSAWTLPCRYFAITHGTAVNLDATGNANQALDWEGVNFLNCATIGTIKNYSNAIFMACAHLGSSSLTFDGSIGTIGFTNCLFDAASSGTSLVLPSTLTVTRRFRIAYCAFVTLSGETGIDVDASATIPDEGYILDTVNFSGGGTYTTGVLPTDNKAKFTDVVGTDNSASVGYMTMTGNATATTITTQGVAVKVAGTTTFQSAVSQKFEHSANRLTYKGAISRVFKVDAVISVLASNNTQIGTYIAVNGSVVSYSEIYTTADGNNRSENVKVMLITQLDTDDYVEVWIENDSNTNNITVEDLSCTVTAVPG